ncbi:unnamed protein product [Moneuplotes crassus]|uniref:Uncharacterized protein n=1 Tax=Euplotes crassus TaxID=5936 RepID=A0AAD1U7H2_EUPCR|nr:unnamed protein product [Moneuplotes crassus]
MAMISHEFSSEELMLSYKLENEHSYFRNAMPSLNVISENIVLPIEVGEDYMPKLMMPESSQMLTCGRLTEESEPKAFTIPSSHERCNEASIFKRLNREAFTQKVSQIFVPQDSSSNNVRTSLDKKKISSEQISLYELIQTQVLPKWKQYIDSKTSRRIANPNKKPRADTFKKKILRDMREFFRILFRKRFDVSECKTAEGVKSCLMTLFEEIGLTLSQEDLNDGYLYKFINQTHLHSFLNLFPIKQQDESSAFKVLEKYNDSRFKTFLKHSLSSQMFYLVFENFLDFYYQLIKPEQKQNVMSILNCFIS